MKSDHDNPRDPVTIDLPMLAAFVDGQLMASEAAALQVRIEIEPLAKARVAAWRAQDAALRALCYALENEAPPLVVLSKRRPWPRAMAVAASWLAVGAGLGAVIGGSVPRSFEVPCAGTRVCAACGRRLRRLFARGASSGRSRCTRRSAFDELALDAARPASFGAFATGIRLHARRWTTVTG
jgi:anti-sigma factor RsiW